jgi:predicted aspartyl protease
MLEGRVNRQGEPVVKVQLVLHRRPISFPAIVDTGFNGYLSVPKRLLRGSKWRAIGTEKFEIATGAFVEQEIYLGEAIFDGRRAPVYSVSTKAQDILVGTKLLRGKILLVNFRTNRVAIR